MKLIAGLGNPGPQYKDTRHNLGFMVADLLADILNVAFTRVQDNALFIRAHYAGETVLLAKPQTYMNNSGRAIAAIAHRNGCTPADILVMVDDRDLPLGKVRLRPGGAAGGHNGVKSVIACLGDPGFHRLRMGIQPETPDIRNLSAFVLARFAQEEHPVAAEMVRHARDAALCWLEYGIEHAMNRYN